MALISESGAKALRAYQYRGNDLSLMYKYVCSPLAQRLVDFLPRNVMPNTITLIGTSIAFSTYFTMAWHRPLVENMEGGKASSEDCPNWVFAWMGIGLLIYQTLDNMDGKQARRTGRSSPLGLLFDHGCDALNTVAGVLNICSAINFGASWETLLSYGMVSTMFYCATWEEFHCGEMTLPIINGPTDGLIINAMQFWSVIFLGQEFWDSDVALPGMIRDGANAAIGAVTGISEPVIEPTYKMRVVGARMMLLGVILTVVGNIQNVYQASGARRGKKNSKSNDDHSFAMSSAIVHGLVPWFGLVGLSWWLYFNTSDGLFEQHPRLFIWTFGFMFSRIVTRAMIAHLCNEKLYAPWKEFIIPTLAVAAHVIGSGIVDPESTTAAFTLPTLTLTVSLSELSEWYLLVELFVIASGRYVYLIYQLFTEMRIILDINAFSPGRYSQHAKES